MKKLMHITAFSLAFLLVTPANRANASSPSGILAPGDSLSGWQTHSSSQQVSPLSDHVIPSSVMQAAPSVNNTPVSIPSDLACKGDAARATPPIPNNPTHIRNVIWRNMRAMCLQQIAQKAGSLHPVDQH